MSHLRLAERFDLVLVGTGFASSFFLHRYLQLGGPRVRVLVLERGARRDHQWHLANQHEALATAQQSFTNATPLKPWNFRVAFGGGSNGWWACTPRLLPEDFRLKTTWGVGEDWPLSYDDLEQHYCDAEDLMAVSGSSDGPSPRSRPYPQPPHTLTDPDRLFKQRFPGSFFNQPTARPSVATAARPRCCATGTCETCPIDSLFTILNEMSPLYADERVTLVTGATVTGVDTQGNVATGVRFTVDGVDQVARTETVGLGANAIFNPFLLLQSGLDGPAVGRGLVEQMPAGVDVLLDGVDNFQGSTSVTGLGYMLYGGPHRREHAAALMETWNVPLLRNERGKWRQRLFLKFIYEDLPQDENRVTRDPSDSMKPLVIFGRRSEYANRGFAALESDLPSVLAALPVARYTIRDMRNESEGHIQCTTRMGNDETASVVDRHLVHHRIRNLLVLGSSVFPTAPPANPTLTIGALSLWAADRLLQRGRAAT